MIRLCAPLIVMLFAAVCAAATQQSGTVYFEQGYFCALEPVRRDLAENTVSGDVAIVEGSPNFIGPGPDVPARIGIGMGVNVQMQPGAGGPATVEVRHPPMGLNGVTHQTWQTDLSETNPHYLGYSFDYPYELVPGLWTLSASANGRTVYMVTFNVVPAAQMPWITCGQNIPLS
jgi:hypothetical protein